MRTVMIREERAELMRIRDEGHVDHAVLSAVLGQLDAEETALVWSATRSGAVRASPLRPPDRIAGAMVTSRPPRSPRPRPSPGAARAASPTGCAGYSCGPARPAARSVAATPPHPRPARRRAHFRETGHPVMRSITGWRSLEWAWRVGVTWRF